MFIQEIFESGASQFENRTASVVFLTCGSEAEKWRGRWLKNRRINFNLFFLKSLRWGVWYTGYELWQTSIR